MGAFDKTNAIVVDVESAENPEKCIYCDYDNAIDHQKERYHDYTPIGWENRLGYGISIGCYWDFWRNDHGMFDSYTLPGFIKLVVERKAMLISFNGLGFDFPLMYAIMMNKVKKDHELYERVSFLAKRFEEIYKSSYDILHEVKMKSRRSHKGLNTLNSLCEHNGIAVKSGSGKEAPELWKQRRVAQLVEYCLHDVMITKKLCETISSNEGLIKREDDSIQINYLKKDGKELVIAEPSYHKQYDMFN